MNRREALKTGLWAALFMAGCRVRETERGTEQPMPTAQPETSTPSTTAIVTETEMATQTATNVPITTETATETVVSSLTATVTPEMTATPEGIRPTQVRGIYMPYERVSRLEEVKSTLEGMGALGANTLVVDIKSESGRVNVPFEHELKNPKNDWLDDPENLAWLLGWAKERGIYVVGRQVVMSDSRLVEMDRRIALRDGGGVVTNSSGNIWLDPSNPKIAEYNAAIAKAAAGFGIDEIQLDYIRYPQARLDLELEYRVENIARILSAVKEVLAGTGVLLTADFLEWSITASETQSDGGVGQDVQRLALLLDGLCPMLYPDLYMRGIRVDPYQHLFTRTTLALEKLRKGGNLEGFVNPWIQAYWPLETPEKIEEQMSGAFAAGALGVHAWNARGHYENGALVDG